MIILSNERSFFTFFVPLTCLEHIHFGSLLIGSSRYKYTVKIRALACTPLEIYRVYLEWGTSLGIHRGQGQGYRARENE